MTTDATIERPHVADAAAGRPVGKLIAVFCMTWIAYASYYFARMGFPVIKSTLEKKLGLSINMLGWIDTGYLTAYAIGQFVSGFLGDRIGSRRLVGLGMLGVAMSCAAFGVSSVAWMFLIFYTLNGMFQSTGWPGTCKAMGSWLTPRERGTIMGFWSTCYQIGPLAATALCTYLFSHYGWRWAFLAPAGLIAVVALVNLFFLPERHSPAASDDKPADVVDAREIATHAEFSVWRSPVLWSLGASYFCLKLIRYSIFFWLPYYLNVVLKYPADLAGYRSTSFTIGGVVGSIAVGFLSDRYFPGRRRIISALMCMALAAALLLYTHVAPISVTLNFISMGLIGFCLFGPDTIICGAAAQDIGGKHNVAKAAGFINGMGSIGAIFQGAVTSGVTKAFGGGTRGWNALFYVFVALAVMASIALLVGKRHTSEDRAPIA